MPLDMPDLTGNKRTYAIVGGAAAAFVAYRWYQSRSAVDTSTPVDATLDTGSVTDAAGGSYGPGNVQYGGADVSGESETPTTNAEWTAAAVTALVNQGWDGATVQAALGRYLTDQTLSTEQETIVRSAIAVAGNAPQGSHTIIHMPTPATPAATKPKAPAGFVTAMSTKNAATVTWSSVTGATSYEVFQTSPSTWWGSSTVTTAKKDFSGLHPATRYTYKARAIGPAGAGPWSTPHIFQTKK
jgi:hypothetical protein